MANIKPLKLGATGAETMAAADTANFPGGVSVGTASAPTAWLMAGAGTSTVAPLLLTSGTNLSSPANGAIEYDGEYHVTVDSTRLVIPAFLAGRATGQTAANSNIVSLTVGSSDASYLVSGNVLVTTSSGENFNVKCDFTDESNTARTLNMNVQILDGSVTANVRFANGAVPYFIAPLQIRCKASTAVTIKTSGTFTGCTYNIEGRITRV